MNRNVIGLSTTMIFLIISVFVPMGIFYTLSLIVEQLTGARPRSQRYLIIACLLYAISWYLPSPLIEGRDTSFMTHLVGGGIFSGFVWLHIKNHLKWKSNDALQLMSLYAFVSALGVTNELFELVIVKLGVIHINASDTWWDLLANTLGALIFWIFYRATRSDHT